ncbi:hypothetical protein HDU67_007349 [Dinochytrium kinnereticum]|nr:hypothetical protein HDU67_007349 [Dinochytrium kinnereticum]
MLSRSANAILKAASSTSASSSSVTRSAVVMSAVRGYSNIRDAGGAFAKKEAAQEEKFVHDHDQELIKKLKADLEKKAAEAAAHPAPAAPKEAEPVKTSDPAQARVSLMDSSYGGSVRAGGGALGKKEAAIEEKYFRDLEKEKLAKSRKH